MPPIVTHLVAAINGGDTPAFFALLTNDAVVDDWGSRYTGLEAIRKWNDRELIGAKGTLRVSNVHVNGDEITFQSNWKSNFFTGAGRFTLVTRGGRIREMRIAEL